jgi:hypothetical protein
LICKTLITTDTKKTTEPQKPVKAWISAEVADWAPEVLNFANLSPIEKSDVDKTSEILFKEDMNGAALLLIDDCADMQASLSLLEGHSIKLWAEIEKLQTAHKLRKAIRRLLKMKATSLYAIELSG